MRAFFSPSFMHTLTTFCCLLAPSGCIPLVPFSTFLSKDASSSNSASFLGVSRESQAAYRSNLSPFDLSQTFPSWIGSFSFLLSPPPLSSPCLSRMLRDTSLLSFGKERVFAQIRALKRTLQSLLDSLNLKGRKERNY